MYKRQEQSNPEQQPLWHYDSAPAKRQPQTLTFIPWFSWANRGEGEMRIWVNEEKPVSYTHLDVYKRQVRDMFVKDVPQGAELLKAVDEVQ